jgi:hypothetical protein
MQATRRNESQRKKGASSGPSVTIQIKRRHEMQEETGASSGPAAEYKARRKQGRL